MRISDWSSDVCSSDLIQALDMYNTFWDPTVHPVNLHKDGEFAARISRRSTYWLQQRCLSGLYFNCEDIIKNKDGNWMNQSYVEIGRASGRESVCQYE